MAYGECGGKQAKETISGKVALADSRLSSPSLFLPVVGTNLPVCFLRHSPLTCFYFCNLM